MFGGVGSRALDVDLLQHLYRTAGNDDWRQRFFLERFAECQTEALGGQILKCGACGTRIVHYNPCNVRGCPKCAGYHQARWRESLRSRLLPIGHYHVVFSGPAWLADLWQRVPREVINALFESARRSLKRVFRPTGLRYGATLVFQSHGARMCYKPHIHCLLTPGGLDDRHEWQEHRTIDEPSLQEAFQRELVKQLEKHSPQQLNQVLRDCHRSTSANVYLTFHEQTPNAIIGYLSGSTHGLVLGSNAEIEVGEAGVHFTSTHGESGNLSPEDFLRRYIDHIPPHRAVTVRHYGLYANRCAAQRRRARACVHAHEQLEEAPEEEQQPYLPACPHCHRRKLKVEREFEPDHLPTELRLQAIIRGSPIGHDAILTVASRGVATE